MNLPYQCLYQLGQTSVLCAAKGTRIHTFDLSSGGSFLSSWTHPLSNKAEKDEPLKNEEITTQEGQDPAEQESGQRPSKKRKLSSDEKSDVQGGNGQADAGTAEPAASGDGKKQKKQKQKSESRAQQPELPFVALLTATEDGSHVVAVTGQDKAIWVFEHDGKGTLKELSQRVMPKRPSSIAITTTADGLTILSADKFGDVYSLPLIPTSTPITATTETSNPPTPASTTTPPPSTPFKPSANRLTVHSKRNLRALEDQERILAQGQEIRKEKDTPAFTHDLILGHVSMLTSLATASSDGRSYILTADRDEHIRVSRGVPQAHVIETYCLGHESFVAALDVPALRPEVLVSAGGDDEVFVWEWKAGKLLCKADVLARVREVVPAANKVAVARLCSYDVRGRCYVLVICELVPAIFVFELLQDNTLEHVQTLNVPGSPLDVIMAPSSEGNPRLIVSIDPHQSTDSNDEVQGNSGITKTAQSLLLYEPDDAGTWVSSGSIQETADGNLDISRDQLENILYPVEKLRKTEFEEEAEAEGGDSARGSVAP
ncbi:uncharacterized protein GGS22DRAFT_6580 [Annulohypoxylon maeteangense]|uniref:uncharacterized protein n=1 Tax=Annulohypoxylon maeteangense TaxID=1927788 RepID=UPI002007C2BB|nr:uncharacterized protein GGS22DRAFT_6580 [Annulohypoxylon maeteangense]KAI0889952.1 hypothetical protein GGS22DRAFT_6580 [Annulohypoxylon maeteangense]